MAVCGWLQNSASILQSYRKPTRIEFLTVRSTYEYIPFFNHPFTTLDLFLPKSSHTHVAWSTKIKYTWFIMHTWENYHQRSKIAGISCQLREKYCFKRISVEMYPVWDIPYVGNLSFAWIELSERHALI